MTATARRYDRSVVSPPVTAAPTPRRLGLATRVGMRLRHTVLLGRQVGRYGAEQGLWWLVPVVIVVILFAVAVTTTTTALPVAVYTLV